MAKIEQVLRNLTQFGFSLDFFCITNAVKQWHQASRTQISLRGILEGSLTFDFGMLTP